MGYIGMYRGLRYGFEVYRLSKCYQLKLQRVNAHLNGKGMACNLGRHATFLLPMNRVSFFGFGPYKGYQFPF